MSIDKLEIFNHISLGSFLTFNFGRINIITGYNIKEKYFIINALKAIYMNKLYKFNIGHIYKEDTGDIILSLNIKDEHIKYLINKRNTILIEGNKEYISEVIKVEYEIPGDNINQSISNWYYKITGLNVNRIHEDISLYSVISLISQTYKLKKDNIVLIRNIESNLHPAIQNRIGDYLLYLVSKGVQIFIETNSDYIINSFRIGIKKRRVRGKDIKIIDFNNNRKDIMKYIEIKENGEIHEWPKGFFDRMDEDFKELFGI